MTTRQRLLKRLLVVFIVAGCASAPPPVWEKQGATATIGSPEHSQCASEAKLARASFSWRNATTIGMMRRSSIKKCMEAKGWKLRNPEDY
jgi:hypothetical protein